MMRMREMFPIHSVDRIHTFPTKSPPLIMFASDVRTYAIRRATQEEGWRGKWFLVEVNVGRIVSLLIA